MLNRTIGPEIKPLNKIELMKPDSQALVNGSSMHVFNVPGSGVIRFEIIFNAGAKYQNRSLAAGMCASMLTEGTKKHTSEQIAEYFDFHGAYLQTDSDYDYSGITVFGLTKNFQQLVSMIDELLRESIFPEAEFNIMRNNNLQKLKVNSGKVDFIARQHFFEKLFGSDTSYGKIITAEDYNTLTRENLITHYEQNIKDHPFTIILSGDCTHEITQSVQHTFSQLAVKHKKGDQKIIAQPLTGGKFLVEKADAVQSAIRLGMPSITRKHEDFPAMQITNMILGGYFGSRLMSNIREDKGYTYGIGSSLNSMVDASYYTIATEVGADVCKDALNEIYKEINILRTELVPEQELELARNYMIGSFIRNSDGPFAMADRFKSVYLHGMDYGYYDYYFEVINKITAEEIKAMAAKHLKAEYIVEVVAGKK
jgi:zinc protease